MTLRWHTVVAEIRITFVYQHRLWILFDAWLVVVYTRSHLRDGNLAEDHGPQKLDNSPGPKPEVVERRKVAKEHTAQRVSSWTVENAMRGVLGQIATCAE